MAVSYEFGRDAYNQWQAYQSDYSMAEIVEHNFTSEEQSAYDAFVQLSENEYKTQREIVLDSDDIVDNVVGKMVEVFDDFIDILEVASSDSFERCKDDFIESCFNQIDFDND